MTNPHLSPTARNPSGSRQLHPVYEGYLRIGPLTRLPQLLGTLGLDPLEITRSAGLDLAQFDDPENMIPFAAVGRLLKLSAEKTRCPYFGLLVGQQSGLDSLGVIGELARNSPDAGSALRRLILHLHIHDRGAVPVLSVHRDLAVLNYLIYQQGVEGTVHIYDGSIAIIFNILRTLCGPAWLPTEVLFSRRLPDDIGPYRRFFQAPLRFNMEQTALVFPARWLDTVVAGADAVLCRQLEQQIYELEHLEPHDLAAQLRRVLRTLLITRRSSEEHVAELFSMHRRTLNRRLEEQGLTFRGVVNEIRYEIASQLLENTTMLIAQIAATLDYSAPSAFTRAFRGWSGMTPIEWRTRLFSAK